MTVILVATLDTKGNELAFVRALIRDQGVETLVIDAGSLGPPAFEADFGRDEVFLHAGTSFEATREHGDRGRAVADASRGLAALVKHLAETRPIFGIFGLGGSAGTQIGTAAMRELRFGVPKVMVSTLASGQMRPFVGGSDIAMFHSVADVAGLNRMTRTVLANAAMALVGMVSLTRPDPETLADRPVIAASMFGVTTPCLDRARGVLSDAGYEVVVFHATGVGGQAMEGLVRDGEVAGVLDITTTELADELVGGILSAGPDRLEAAGRRGIPQVVSVGALDMVNFGPRATVPERFAGRHFHAHNPSVTLMRTTRDENAALGTRMAEILGRARGSTVVMIPRQGVSALDAPGLPFHDPEADEALFTALIDGLAVNPLVRVDDRDEHINDPSFAEAAARALMEMVSDPSNPGDATHVPENAQ